MNQSLLKKSQGLTLCLPFIGQISCISRLVNLENLYIVSRKSYIVKKKSGERVRESEDYQRIVFRIQGFDSSNPSLFPLPLEGEGLPCVVEEITAQGKGEGDKYTINTRYGLNWRIDELFYLNRRIGELSHLISPPP